MTPDPARRPVTRATHVREHFRTSGSPDGHGYTRRNADQGTAYYAFDHGIVRCVVLDTVNEHGGWQGSLDTGQLSWLVAELRECAARPVLLFSHHPLETMVNDLRPPGAGRRVLGPELRDVLLAHPCVIGWVNGHTHVHAIQAVREDGAPGGFWQITTASHIDWPQQARLIELFETDGGLVIGCTVIDSAAPASYRGRETRTPWPTRPCWLRWHASSPPTTGRSATRSAPKAARARASRPTGMCCSRSTGPGRCHASADRPLPRYRVQRAYQLPQSTRCHHRRVSSTCHLNCRGGLSFQPWRHRPSLSRQSPGQSPAQCRQCLVRLTSAMSHDRPHDRRRLIGDSSQNYEMIRMCGIEWISRRLG